MNAVGLPTDFYACLEGSDFKAHTLLQIFIDFPQTVSGILFTVKRRMHAKSRYIDNARSCFHLVRFYRLYRIMAASLTTASPHPPPSLPHSEQACLSVCRRRLGARLCGP